MYSIDSYRCPADHKCPLVGICPVGAIVQEGIGLPVILDEKCIECGKCEKYCPMRAVVVT